MLKKSSFAIRLLKPKSWKRLWRVLSSQERVFMGAASVVFIIALIIFVNQIFNRVTKIEPAFGGTLVEGLVGSPHFLNPLLTSTDSDRDMTRLIFSTLLKYNDDGDIIGDAAENYNVSKDGKTYRVTLKKNIFWHDGKPLTPDDVVFTINAVQNPEYASYLRNAWQGVTIERSGENELVFKLKTPYANFAENLTSLGILPKHIWSNIQPKNFALADFNIKPVGSGPFKFVKLQKDQLGRITSLTFEASQTYFNGMPFIKTLVFKSYSSEEEAVSAFNRKEIDSLVLATAQNKNQLRGLGNSTVFSLISPRTYALFLNTDNMLLKEKAVRLAVNYAINRQDLLTKVLNNDGKLTAGPIPPGLLGSSPEIEGYEYNPAKAEEILDKAGWKKNEEGTRSKKLDKGKDFTKLGISILASPATQLAATLIKDNLKNIGIEIDLKILTMGELQQNIRTRQYQSLLIGESYSSLPDPYSFWHSTAKKEPGLNLSLYSNKKVDKLLEDARQTMDEAKRAAKYVEFQKLVIADAPAAFLYSPNYLYVIKKDIQGVDIEKLVLPSDRFSEINQWYISTQRVLK